MSSSSPRSLRFLEELRWPAWRVAVIAGLLALAFGWRSLRPLIEAYAVQASHTHVNRASLAILKSRLPDGGEMVPHWSIFIFDEYRFRPTIGWQVADPGTPWGAPRAEFRVHCFSPGLKRIGEFRSRDLHVWSNVGGDWDNDGLLELPLLLRMGPMVPGRGYPEQTRFCVIRFRESQTEVVAIVDDLSRLEAWRLNAIPSIRARRRLGGAAFPIQFERSQQVGRPALPLASAPAGATSAPTTTVTNGDLGRLRWTRPGGTMRAYGEWAPEMRVYTPPIDQPWVLPAGVTIQAFIEKVIAEQPAQIPDAE